MCPLAKKPEADTDPGRARDSSNGTVSCTRFGVVAPSAAEEVIHNPGMAHAQGLGSGMYGVRRQ